MEKDKDCGPVKKLTQAPHNCYGFHNIPYVAELVNDSSSRVYLDALKKFNSFSKGIYNVSSGTPMKDFKPKPPIWGANSNIISANH